MSRLYKVYDPYDQKKGNVISVLWSREKENRKRNLRKWGQTSLCGKMNRRGLTQRQNRIDEWLMGSLYSLYMASKLSFTVLIINLFLSRLTLNLVILLQFFSCCWAWVSAILITVSYSILGSHYMLKSDGVFTQVTQKDLQECSFLSWDVQFQFCFCLMISRVQHPVYFPQLTSQLILLHCSQH